MPQDPGLNEREEWEVGLSKYMYKGGSGGEEEGKRVHHDKREEMALEMCSCTTIQSHSQTPLRVWE